MMKTFDKVLIDLTGWSGGSPCGAVCFSNNEAVLSEYCDSVDDFKEFLDGNKNSISETTVLSFEIRAYDISYLAEPIAEIDRYFTELVDEHLKEGD